MSKYKLEIKHLVYQNYKPLMAWNPNDKVLDLIISIEYDTPILSFLNSNTNCLLEHSKLALVPLSELNHYSNGLSILDYDTSDESIEDIVNSILQNVAPYDLMKMCFEEHIDVFRLIDKGLAVNKNALPC